jgi:glycosyltransferase involved in cell wall biosynthesis
MTATERTTLPNTTMSPGEHKQLRGFRGKVVCLNVTETRTENFIRELERRGFEVLPYRTQGWRSALVNFVSFARAAVQADFVLCGGTVPAQIPWMLAARLLGRACILDFPMDLTEWPFPKAFGWACYVRLTLRCASGVLTIRSRAYVIEKFGLNRRRVRFLESCPDAAVVEPAQRATPRFRPRPDSILLCWSGGHEHHRLERFMPTFHKLIELAPNAELLVIADPRKPSVIETIRYAESAGLADRVHVLPVIKPPADFYATIAQCDIWIATLGDDTLQGRQELRMELMEAGLLARSVVSAKTPALVEHGLVDGQEILYIDPSHPAASARRIAELAADPQARARMGGQLRARVMRSFSLKDAVDDLLGFAVRSKDAVSTTTEVASPTTAG